MMYLLCPTGSDALQEILHKALIRSFTRRHVQSISVRDWQSLIAEKKPCALVIADAPEEWANDIVQSLGIPGSKLMLLGRIPQRLALQLGARVSALPESIAANTICPPAATYKTSQSEAIIQYRDSIFGAAPPMKMRACTHFDFTDEWNNLGYGAIRGDQSIWALAQQVVFPASQNLADVTINGQASFSYAALVDSRKSSLLWFNRPVGPVDSQEWRLVEQFFSGYRYPDLVCLPVIREIPAGFDAAVTMRLDCDEDIASSEALFDFYQSEKIPFSLALHTSVLADQKHKPYLQKVCANGGSILSHSATHPVDWGGNYDNALREVITSRNAIADYLGNVRCDYAVSPFHQTPSYAAKAMADGGLHGFVGGIIRNDPAYLMARGGEVPDGPQGFVSHSQQCMLHGDCLLQDGDPLASFKQNFDDCVRNGAVFGYLDHPFSPRYQYGWKDEAQRIDAHRGLIAHIRKAGKVLFMSENQTLDWFRMKAAARLTQDAKGRWSVMVPDDVRMPWRPEIESGDKIAKAKGAA